MHCNTSIADLIAKMVTMLLMGGLHIQHKFTEYRDESHPGGTEQECLRLHHTIGNDM
jgi:hypothetical protein